MKSLLYATLSAAALMLHCSGPMQSAHDRAEAWVKAHGGAFSENFKAVGVAPDPDGIARLELDSAQITDADLKHIDALGHIYALNLRDTGITDAGLAYVSRLSSLRSLALDRTKITDLGLAQVSRLLDLQGLTLSHTQVTDAGLARLSTLSKLMGLTLTDTPIDGSGLAALQKGTIEVLALDDTRVDDRALSAIGQMPRLRILSLAATRVTDKGLPRLGDLKELDILDLGHTAITGEGLASLAMLPKLRALGLNHTRLGEGAAAALAKLKGLEALHVVKAGLSAEAIDSIKRALPRCNVEDGAPAPEIAGTLHYSGGWTDLGPRRGAGEWLVYAFEARAGDRFTAYVRSNSGAPVVRLADDQQKPLADSQISHPDGGTIAVAGATATKDGTCYVLVRDAADAAATFSVQLGLTGPCHQDADCERAGGRTGDPNAPHPDDLVPYCSKSSPGEAGRCTTMHRGEPIEQSPKPGK